MSGFYDLNVPFVDPDSTRTILKKLGSAGYHSVAVNHRVEIERNTKTVEGAKAHFQDDEIRVTGHRHPMRILNRLTVTLTENSPLYLFAQEGIQSYDILAVSVSNEKQFMKVCMEMEVDIIQLNFEARLPFSLRMAPIRAAIDRGVHFEIIYSAALTSDSLTRCNVIAGARQLVRLAREKNIIVSGQADTAMQVRSPYDVTNLGLLFGWDADKSKAAISKNGRAVLYHAEARRGLGRAAVRVQPVGQLDTGHHWQVRSIEQCRKEDSSDGDEDESGDDDDEEGESGEEMNVDEDGEMDTTATSQLAVNSKETVEEGVQMEQRLGAAPGKRKPDSPLDSDQGTCKGDGGGGAAPAAKRVYEPSTAHR